MSGLASEPPAQRRRDAIVTAAARFFAERGYAAVGMRDVAEAVGVRGASLYHHFASKEEILFAICLTVTEEPNAQNLPLLDAPGTCSQRLAALVRGQLVQPDDVLGAPPVQVGQVAADQRREPL